MFCGVLELDWKLQCDGGSEAILAVLAGGAGLYCCWAFPIKSLASVSTWSRSPMRLAKLLHSASQFLSFPRVFACRR